MTATVSAIAIPEDSLIASYLPDAYFADAYQAALQQPSRSALEIYLGTVAQTPPWLNGLMSLRNRVVSVLGLKNLGSMSAVDLHKSVDQYRVGDRVGIFSIHSLTEREVVLIDSDKHLDAKISVCKIGSHITPAVVVSTVVHVHNNLGRVYLFFVVPMHRLIVPAILRRALQNL